MTPRAYVQYKQYIQKSTVHRVQYSTVPPSCWRGTSCGWEGYLFLSGSVLASGPIASPNLLNRAGVVAPRPEQSHRLVRQPLHSPLPIRMHSNRLIYSTLTLRTTGHYSIAAPYLEQFVWAGIVVAVGRIAVAGTGWGCYIAVAGCRTAAPGCCCC